MADLLETITQQVLEQTTQELVLLEPQGSHEVLEVPIAHVLLEPSQDNTLVEPVVSTVLLTEGVQGPPGPQGMPGPAGGQVLQRSAGMTVSALVVVYEDMFGQVWPADHDAELDVIALLGVTLSAADPSQLVNVQRLGFIDDDSWRWQPGGRVYLGRQGRLVQTPPTGGAGGYDVLIGTALSATRLLLNIQDPIELE